MRPVSTHHQEIFHLARILLNSSTERVILLIRVSCASIFIAVSFIIVAGGVNYPVIMEGFEVFQVVSHGHGDLRVRV